MARWGQRRPVLGRGLVLSLVVGWALATGPSAAAARLVLVDVPARVQPQARQLGEPWDHYPSVLIISPKGDPRLPLTRQAVAFWNQQLHQLASPFRLGPVADTTAEITPGLIPDDLLIAIGRASARGGPRPPVPEQVWTLPGDIIVDLSTESFVSFSTLPGPGRKVLVGIRSANEPPLSLPNVARNVIAHELGHAVGLDHNEDPTMLMCGRPAECRPDLFRSINEHYFPLTSDERELLARMYPPTWTPAQ